MKRLIVTLGVAVAAAAVASASASGKVSSNGRLVKADRGPAYYEPHASLWDLPSRLDRNPIPGVWIAG